MNNSKLFLALLFIVFFLVRLPAINSGLPFFYDEDEAHHFNRTTRMLQSGDLNPHYFHKPSVHFYLRIPVLITSFFWTVKNGHIKKIEEIKTKDPFGLAGYNFAVSHIGIVKWQRAFSVALQLLSIFLVYLIVLNLGVRKELAFILLIATGFSPELITYSAKIGVDMPMLFFSLLATYFSIKYIKGSETKNLVYALILSGICVSTKYNALPIMLTPIFSYFLARKYSLEKTFLIFLLPCLGFFIGSPYILVELPLFLNQFAYEIWHYGVAGHQGHMAEPGIKQFLHYFFWLGNLAIGWIFLFLALIGFLLIFIKRKKEDLVFLSFPLIFFLLMLSQKANFERNMLVVIPYFLVLATFTLNSLANKKGKLALIIGLIAFIQPVYQSSIAIAKDRKLEDSRIIAKKWLETNSKDKVVAVSGELEFPPFVNYMQGNSSLSIKSVKRVNLSKESIFSLYQNGFKQIVIEANYKLNEFEKSILQLIKEFKGDSSIQRIKKNPAINIYEFKSLDPVDLKDKITSFKIDTNGKVKDCSYAEGFCWLNKKLLVLELPKKVAEVNFKIMSPFKDQKVSLSTLSGLKKTINLTPQFNRHSFTSQKVFSKIYIKIDRILTPDQFLGINDKRNLGVAIKKTEF